MGANKLPISWPNDGGYSLSRSHFCLSMSRYLFCVATLFAFFPRSFLLFQAARGMLETPQVCSVIEPGRLCNKEDAEHQQRERKRGRLCSNLQRRRCEYCWHIERETEGERGGRGDGAVAFPVCMLAVIKVMWRLKGAD